MSKEEIVEALEEEQRRIEKAMHRTREQQARAKELRRQLESER
ncbi:unnamed protein product [marine sediment metagenome]|uniref:Uncharacterized protein n=1 Tax=marine sediment metagenome TaxID=412755 RepID=X1J092_9ZZZZ